MLIFIKILLIVYLVAINFYGFMLIGAQKRAEEDGDSCKVKDGKIFVTGLLGGALGVYVSMFIYKYRLTSLMLMVFMPVFIAVNVYLVIMLFSQNFGFLNNMQNIADSLQHTAYSLWSSGLCPPAL